MWIIQLKNNIKMEDDERNVKTPQGKPAVDRLLSTITVQSSVAKNTSLTVGDFSATKSKMMHTSLRNLRLFIPTFSVRHGTNTTTGSKPKSFWQRASFSPVWILNTRLFKPSTFDSVSKLTVHSWVHYTKVYIWPTKLAIYILWLTIRYVNCY